MKDDRFACPCCGVNLMRKEAIDLFNQMEAMLGKLNITSAYRCPKHNTEIGGAKSSTHMIGVAFDILTPEYDYQQRVIKEALKAGFKGIGRGGSFVHIDMRKFPEFWVYADKDKKKKVASL